MKLLPQGLGWGPANTCKPLVWSLWSKCAYFQRTAKTALGNRASSLQACILG